MAQLLLRIKPLHVLTRYGSSEPQWHRVAFPHVDDSVKEEELGLVVRHGVALAQVWLEQQMWPHLQNAMISLHEWVDS